MINLLRMNLYRMLRTRSLQIILLIAMLFAGFSTYMSTLDIATSKKSFEQSAEDGASGNEKDASTQAVVRVQETDPQDDPASFGIYVATPVNEDGSLASFLQFYCADISSRLLLIFLTIALVLFFHSEEKTGFVKNIAGQTRHRYYLFLSQLVTFILYQLALMLVYGFTQFIILKLAYGGELTFGVSLLGKALPFLGGQFWLYFAFAAGIATITTLFHSSTLSITFGILACCGFGSILYGWIEKLLHVDITPYFLTSRMNTLSLEMSTKTLYMALLAGLIFLTAYTLISSIWITKKDVV